MRLRRKRKRLSSSSFSSFLCGITRSSSSEQEESPDETPGNARNLRSSNSLSAGLRDSAGAAESSTSISRTRSAPSSPNTLEARNASVQVPSSARTRTITWAASNAAGDVGDDSIAGGSGDAASGFVSSQTQENDTQGGTQTTRSVRCNSGPGYPRRFPYGYKEVYFDEMYKDEMRQPGNLFQFNLIYSCAYCRAHLAIHSDLISRSFQGSHGRAYLFDKVVNVSTRAAEERLLLTGLHAVADIYCECCRHTLGWKYEKAYEKSQKYKEGRFIIEQAHMVKTNNWNNPES